MKGVHISNSQLVRLVQTRLPETHFYQSCFELGEKPPHDQRIWMQRKRNKKNESVRIRRKRNRNLNLARRLGCDLPAPADKRNGKGESSQENKRARLGAAPVAGEATALLPLQSKSSSLSSPQASLGADEAEEYLDPEMKATLIAEGWVLQDFPHAGKSARRFFKAHGKSDGVFVAHIPEDGDDQASRRSS